MLGEGDAARAARVLLPGVPEEEAEAGPPAARAHARSRGRAPAGKVWDPARGGWTEDVRAAGGGPSSLLLPPRHLT